MKRKKDTALMLTLVLAIGTALTGGWPAKADAGRMVESFDLKVSDASKYADLKASDFEITGNYDGYPLNENNEAGQADYTDDGVELSWNESVLSIKVKPFK